MKQNHFCTAANKTAEICKRDFGSTSPCSYHSLFFSSLSLSLLLLFQRQLCKRPADLAVLSNFPLSLDQTQERVSGCSRPLAANHLQTELSNAILQLPPRGLGLRARDTLESLLKSSSWTVMCETKALNVIQYYIQRHRGQRDLCK